MGIAGRIRETFVRPFERRAQEGAVSEPASTGAVISTVKAEVKEGEEAKRGAKTLLSLGANPLLVSTVYRCVDVISSDVAALPLETYRIDREGFKERHYEHPAYDILNMEPDGNMTRFTFMKTLISSVLLTGNGYAYIERDRRGNVERLIYLPSGIVAALDVPDRTGEWRRRYMVGEYRGMRLGVNGVIPPEDMIHIINFPAQDGLTGLSTLSFARRTLAIAAASDRHAQGFFEGGGAPSGVLTVDKMVSLSKEKKEALYKVWDDRQYEAPNSMMILEGGMQYEPISISPKDAQFLESRQFNVVDICRYFSVPPSKAFDLTDANYNTLEAEMLAYLTGTLRQYLVRVEGEINRKVFGRSERHSVRAEFDTTELLRTDKKTQADYFRTMFSTGGITSNEIRRSQNLPRIEGGDRAFVQVNMYPLDNSQWGPGKTEIIETLTKAAKEKEDEDGNDEGKKKGVGQKKA